MENDNLIIEQLHQLIGSGEHENIELAFQIAAGHNMTTQVLKPWKALVKLCNNEFKKNKLSDIDFIKHLTSVDALFLDNCNLQELPLIVTYMQKVYKLDLSGNNIQHFPEEISNMKNLIIIDLSNNQLKTIPKQVQILEILEILNLSKNLIEEIKVLPVNLKALNISRNKFKKTPEFLSQKNKLIGLDIAHNPGFVWDLSELDVKKLHYLTFDDTDISNLKNMEYQRYSWFDDDGKLIRLIGCAENL